MSNENGKLEKWQVQELCDEAVAIGQLRPEMLNEYIYEFDHRGKPVRDLTAASYSQLALTNNLTTEEITKTEMFAEEGAGVFYEVTVARIEDDVPKELWMRKYGVAFEPYMLNGRFDKFCFQKALTKATRNAIKQFITATARHEAINALQGIVPKELSPREKAMKHCFAVYDEHKEALKSLGIADAAFWQAVKEEYSVESRAQMTEAQWHNLTSALQVEGEDGPYAPWIRELEVEEMF